MLELFRNRGYGFSKVNQSNNEWPSRTEYGGNDIEIGDHCISNRECRCNKSDGELAIYFIRAIRCRLRGDDNKMQYQHNNEMIQWLHQKFKMQKAEWCRVTPTTLVGILVSAINCKNKSKKQIPLRVWSLLSISKGVSQESRSSTKLIRTK